MNSTVEQLGPQHGETLRKLLCRDAAQNMYLLGLFEEFGLVPGPGRAKFAFYGRFKEGQLNAVMFVGGDGGLVVPSGNDAAEVIALAEALGTKVKLKATIGDKATVDGMLRYLTSGEKPRLQRSQRLYSVSADDLGPFTNPTLRLATDADFPGVLEMAAGWVKENLDRDALAEDEQGFKARVMQRIRGRRTYVLESSGKLVFKIDVGSRSMHGAELEGLYTIPEERRRGHATLSLGQISRHLLSSLPRLTIRVDDLDASLAGCARKVGYLGQKNQRLVVME
ncbi:MAG: DUF4081 domain-containing protein [Myxococcaceae bacterium]